MKNLYLLILLLAFSSCLSVPKLLDKGRFDRAYELAYKHCTRGRAPSEKQLDHFIEAYAAIQASDQARVSSLQREPGTEKWASLYEVYDNLYGRSLDILKVSPKDAHFDRYPDLAPAHLEQLLEEARIKAGNHYLALAEDLLPAARALEKPAARKAYQLHKRIAYFLPERNAQFAALRDSLIDIGTLRILLYAPEGEFAGEFHRVLQGLEPFKRDWTEIRSWQNGQRIDLEAELVFSDYSDSGPQQSCSTTEYAEEVLDYVEKKKVEERINDSTIVTKIVEIEHYKTVYATVTECDQSRAVRAIAYLDVYLPGRSAPVWQAELSSIDRWSNSFSSGTGDHRALPAFANSGSCSVAPSLDWMLVRAVANLPSAAQYKLKKRYAPKVSASRRKQRAVSLR